LQNTQKSHTVQINMKRIVNNTVISLIGQIITWTSTLLLTSAYGRFLGDVNFGELYLAINFVGLVGFPLETSFNSQLTRDVAQQPEKAMRYLTNTLLLKGLLWVVLYGFIVLLSWLLGYNQIERVLVAVCGITLLSSSIASTFAASHCALERTVFPVIGTILEKGLSALVGIFLLRHGAGVVAMAAVLLGGSLASLIWQASWFFRKFGIHFSFDVNLIRKLLRTSIPFLIYGILGVIYYRIDTFLLSIMTNAAVIGWYGAGYRLFDTMVFLPGIIIGTIMYPVFSKLSTSSEETLKLAIEKSMNFLLFFGIPIATGFIVAAPNIVAFLYHRPEFINTIPVLQYLAPGLVFLYANTVATSILISSNQERKITILAAVALVFNLGLNLLLIPRYQQVGAAVVTSLTEFLLLCVSVVLVPTRLLPVRSLKVGAKAIVASGVMAIAILFFLNRFSIFFLLPAAMFIYLCAAGVLGTIPREDILALYRGVRHKAQPTNPAPVEDQLEIEQSAQALEADEELQAVRYDQLAEDSEVTVKRPRIALPFHFSQVSWGKRRPGGLKKVILRPHENQVDARLAIHTGVSKKREGRGIGVTEKGPCMAQTNRDLSEESN
jgi:O-antigen/teichoic acid export membrane protein